MAGLDSIQKFEDGGEVAVKANAKNQPVITGTMSLDPTQTDELLKNMQDMLDQRTGPMPTFLSGLKDATAWTAGGAQGPASALAERDRAKLQEQQDIQSIRAQMAMYKSAQAQEQQAKERWQQNAGGVPSTVNTAPTTVGGTQTLPTASSGIPVSAEQLAIEAMLPKFTDKEESRKKYLAGRSTESTKKEFAPAMQDVVDIYVPGKGKVQMTKSQAEKYLNTNPNLQAIVDGEKVPAASVVRNMTDVTEAVRNNNPGNIRMGDFAKSLGATGADERGFAIFPDLKTGDTAQHKLLSGDKYNTLPLKGIADVWAPKGDGNNDPTTYTKAMQDMTGFNDATMNKKYVDLTPEQQNLWRSAQKRFEHGATSPSSSTSIAQKPALPNETQQQYDQRIKQEEKIAESRIRAGEAKRDLAIEARDNSIETGNAINRIENTLNTKEGVRAVGVFNKPGVVAAFGKILSEGIQAGNFGAVSFKGLEDAVRVAGGDQAAIDAAQRLARDFAQMQLNIAKRDLKGQGAVSDNERKIVERVTGSTSNSPEVLKDFARWNRVRNEFDKNVGDALENWEEKNPNQSFAKFRQTPEYKKLEADYINTTNQMATKMGVAVGTKLAAKTVDKTDEYLKQYRK